MDPGTIIGDFFAGVAACASLVTVRLTVTHHREIRIARLTEALVMTRRTGEDAVTLAGDSLPSHSILELKQAQREVERARAMPIRAQSEAHATAIRAELNRLMDANATPADVVRAAEQALDLLRAEPAVLRPRWQRQIIGRWLRWRTRRTS